MTKRVRTVFSVVLNRSPGFSPGPGPPLLAAVGSIDLEVATMATVV